jgi:hypothetical protein
MKLSVQDRKQLHKVLSQAFPSSAALNQVTTLYLDVPFDFIAPDGTVPVRVLNLITWAEARDRIGDLIEAAREENSTNQELQALANRLLAALSASPATPDVGVVVQKAEFTTTQEVTDRETVGKPDQPAVATEVLQRITLQSLSFYNTSEWRTLMAGRERAVCRVDFPCETGMGTGFLVGPDLVMTNYHVLELFIVGARKPSEICCRFGYQTSGEGQPIDMGVACPLADDWLVASSPVAELDYAIVRLRDAGPLAAANRLPLTPVPHTFDTGESLFLIQHPKAAPLKIASGGVVKADSKRVFYLANTLRGSSGSPCFTANWELVALHRSGDDVANVGVPLGVIITDVKLKNPTIFS